jgi:hypothetical protein
VGKCESHLDHKVIPARAITAREWGSEGCWVAFETFVGGERGSEAVGRPVGGWIVILTSRKV